MNPTSLQQWLAHIERQHPHSIELGLDRVRKVAMRLQLDKPARKTIVVGGTNGKGSTIAFIEAIALAAGWRTGVYTSPHLLRYNERVRLDGREADDEALIAAFSAVETARGEVALTYFEYGTLAALWLMQRARLDLAVLEVGLGGRLDAVNIVASDVAVITTVDIDHTDWLGQDRESIGREKAGIARAWKPLVLGEKDPPSSVLQHAYGLGADTLRSGCDFFHEPVDASHWRWRDVRHALLLPVPRLVAPVQLANAATAITALRALRRRIPMAAYAQGIATAVLPGRLQRIDREGVEIWTDVAHNPQAARALAAWLTARPPVGRTLAVFAALNDKDVHAVVEALAGTVTDWYLAGLSVDGRSQDAATLARRLRGTVAADGRQYENVAQALAAASATATAEDRILVFGSFHTVAAALSAIGLSTPADSC
ncbi:MAG: bifunctional tetrahydrofolate synthase/dihydrofolate synthase [Xanthomonadaceae bacterium]|nr:bifunctional tetrahydrofolate synthase/dihydrofolate synthase [Xanthomonadaceae bacterium]